MARDLNRFVEAERKLWEHIGVTPTERRVTLRTGEQVRVQEVGEGPPLLLLHGVSVAGSSWATLATRLEGVRCILVDRPGCGLSDPIVGGPLTDLASVENYADRLLGDLLDALELENAAVGATSMGGYYAIRGAATAPERVTKLVEYSWPLGAPIEDAPLMLRVGAAMEKLPGLQSVMTKMPMPRAMVARALAQFGLGQAIRSGAFDDHMLDWAHALLNNTNTLANDGQSAPEYITVKGQNDEVLHSDALLSSLTMPVLFLWGENDPNAGAGIARDFAPRLPNAELVVVKGAEHAPWFDDLETCVDQTLSFLLA